MKRALTSASNVHRRRACIGSAQAEVIQRFWSKVDKNGPAKNEELGPCWNWTAGRCNGYGWFNGRYAHRFSLEISGRTIPRGMFVCHRCDNPICVNPNHLFTGTQLDNIRDMDSKGRRINAPPRGEKHGGAKLNESQVLEIRRRHTGYGSGGRLALEFGVSKALISYIVHREGWKHI